MTRILCAPNRWYPEAMEAPPAGAPGVEIISVTDDPRGKYGRLIGERWQGEETYISIEQDIVIRRDTIDSLENCPEDWCVYGYFVKMYQPIAIQRGGETLGEIREDGYTNISLGCAKFTASAQQAIPWDELNKTIQPCDFCNGSWWHMDVHIAQELIARGFAPHDHGEIKHAHEYGVCTCGCGETSYEIDSSTHPKTRSLVGSFDLDTQEGHDQMVAAVRKVWHANSA